MRYVAQAFKVPKAGLSKEYYEDAFEPQFPKGRAVEGEGHCCRFAAADGATEAAFSGPWARQLVRALRKSGPDRDLFVQALPDLQDRWSRMATRRPLAWYAEEKVRQGSFAAVLALELSDGNAHGAGGSWKALAVGDTCLFQVRGTSLIRSFPISAAAAFNNQPLLISTNPQANSASLDEIQLVEGTWLTADHFYLMTDALACWFLTVTEDGNAPWHLLSRFGTNAEHIKFPSFVDNLRAEHAIRNDDCTLMRVEVFG